MFNRKREILAGLLAFFVLFCLIAVFKDGTGDSGDSVQHYLISRFAFKHPALFFDHWGKPLFTLLSAPFAQFGFTGIKIFNSIIAILTGFFAWKIAELLKIKTPFVATILLFFSPFYFVMIFSGLTEYLFAFIVVLSIYFILKNKLFLAIVIISFIPFVRSEGLVILLVFGLYLILKRKYRFLPFLLTGHLFYSISGYWAHHDLFWVFTKIPYASVTTPYGSGTWYDFFVKLYYIIGLPVYIMLAFGFIVFIIRIINIKYVSHPDSWKEEWILVYGSFGTYFIAHTLFWWFGFFNSMGLGRVLIGVIPLIAIISARGLELFDFIHSSLLRRVLKAIFLLYTISFPFTGNLASIRWNSDFDLTPDQKLVNDLTDYISSLPGPNKYYFSNPYIGMQLGIDPFDPKIHERLYKYKEIKDFTQKSVFIWDSWFSVVEDGIPDGIMNKDQRLIEIKTYQVSDQIFSKFVIYTPVSQKDSGL